MRQSVGIDLAGEDVPDATPLVKLRRLLEEYRLGAAILARRMSPRPCVVCNCARLSLLCEGAPCHSFSVFGPWRSQSRDGVDGARPVPIGCNR